MNPPLGPSTNPISSAPPKANFHEQMKRLAKDLESGNEKSGDLLRLKNYENRLNLHRSEKNNSPFNSGVDVDTTDKNHTAITFDDNVTKKFLIDREEKLDSPTSVARARKVFGGEIKSVKERLENQIIAIDNELKDTARDLNYYKKAHSRVIGELQGAEVLIKQKNDRLLEMQNSLDDTIYKNIQDGSYDLIPAARKLKQELNSEVVILGLELKELKAKNLELEQKIKELESAPKVDVLDNANTLTQTPSNNINFQDANYNYELALSKAQSFKSVADIEGYTRDVFSTVVSSFRNSKAYKGASILTLEREARKALGLSWSEGSGPLGVFDEKNGNKNTFAGVMNERFKELQSQAILDTEQKLKSVYQTRTATNKPLDVDDASRYQGEQDNNSNEEAREDQVRRLFNFKNDIKQSLLKGERFNLPELRKKYSVSKNGVSKVLAEIKNEAQAKVNKIDLKPEVKIESAQPQPQPQPQPQQIQNSQVELPTINSVSGEIGKLESDLDILQLDFKEGAINSGIKTNAEVFKKGLREMLARVGVISGNISAIPPKKSKPFNELKPVRKMGQSEELYKQKVKI